MTQEPPLDPHLPTPLWVTVESDPQRLVPAERVYFVVAVLYPAEVKRRHDSLEAGQARAVEIAWETIRDWLRPTPEVGALVCTVAQAGPGNLPLNWPHRLLLDGTKVWLTEGE